MNTHLRKILSKIAENKFIYRLAQRIAYDHNGENNCDITTNGEMAALKRYLNDCKVVFDVGANVGEWSETVLRINPKIDLHSFEPSQKTFQKLSENINQENVILNNIGLGSKKEKKSFYNYGDESTVNSLYARDLKADTKNEEVLIDTLDNYSKEKNINLIDFLKIDVEGNEFEVLKGSQDMLKNGKIKIIQLEYGGTYIDANVWLKDVWEYFKDFNYVWYKILPNELRLIEKYDQSMDNFQYANYLLINKPS
ncbi:MAG: FkbM family methyltransferase [Candidatus Falkowbacteria bacterium]|nr:FkbM family methyltransferase [Candidatus Falkowbacteria bacterium]